MQAWNGWYHVDGHTYGTWLPGDARGWREKQHKLHVPGDYRNPPPEGFGERLLEYSRENLRQPCVRLSLAQRQLAGRALVEMMLHQETELIALSMDSVHFHLLARFREGDVRRRVGRAKKHAWHELCEAGFEGKLWQRSCHAEPIRDRGHQVNAFHYILNHSQKGAWGWSFREGVYWRGGSAQGE
ncbi:MAG: hypothetical protein NTV86_12610 [Planctomycetota bacterium]|nr:hypothetical protein [Planctomycetota bacterium]